jgi:50S ribosomal subunit-associated GTPase HflX
VYKVLEELGIHAKDTLLVLNKVDALQDQDARSPAGIYPSACGKRGQHGHSATGEP